MEIAEFKKLMTDYFVNNETVKEKYELAPGATFEDNFSPVSIENILFSNVATSMYIMQELFEQFKKDVAITINEQIPGTASWYAYRALQFQYGKELVPETDYYDNEGLTDAQVAAMKVVKYASATEAKDKSVLYVKIAGGNANGGRFPLSAPQLTAFGGYMSEVSYAGVRFRIINEIADDMRLDIDIYYNPLVLSELGERLDSLSQMPIQDAIREHLNNLPFDGVYTNQALVDVLQKVEGVRVVELKYSGSKRNSYAQLHQINGIDIPYSGYYKITDENMKLNFIPYE